jgi:hypothetical protein
MISSPDGAAIANATSDYRKPTQQPKEATAK